jgi:hypothetical protein
MGLAGVFIAQSAINFIAPNKNWGFGTHAVDWRVGETGVAFFC